MPLCTQENVQDLLQITFNNNPEPVITRLIDQASQKVEDYLGRELEEAERTEIHDGRKQRIVRVRVTPVTAVNTVTEDGNSLVDGETFLWYPDGRFVRMAGEVESNWKYKRKGITIVYTGGYVLGTTLPTSIVEACASMVARRFRAGAAYAATPDGISGNIKSVSLDGSDSIEYTDPPETFGDLQSGNMEDLESISRYRRRLHL